MALHVFVLLLVVWLLLCLARLGRLDWLSLRSSSKGATKRTTVQRLLQPRSPDDCPACRLSSANSSGGGSATAPVRPWSEVKSRRGAPKRVDTEGFACPNPQCQYLSNADTLFHAAFRGWQAWACRADPDLSVSSLPYHVHAPFATPRCTG